MKPLTKPFFEKPTIEVTKNLLAKNSPIKIYENPNQEKFQIIQTTRIGINKAEELPHRFYIKDNPFVSKR